MAPEVGNFDHINMVPSGDTKAVVYVSIKNFTPSSGGSGHVTEGRYKLQILKGGAWTDKRSDSEGNKKTGKNLRIPFKIVGPEKYDGVPIIASAPAQKGKDDFNYQWFQGLAWGLAAAAGKLEQAQSMDGMPIGPETIAERFVYAYLGDGKGDFANRSEIKRFISPEEYAANPGPANGIPEVSESPAQTSRPEVLPANGSTKIATVDASIPF